MARPKGSKNKDVVGKVLDAIEVVAAQLPKAESEEQAEEIEEAVQALTEIIEADAPKGSKLVGKHPITGKPVYV